MSTSIQYLSGIGFLAFAEQLPLLQEELSVRFKIDVTTQHSKLYGNMLFLPDCTARVIPYWAQCTLQEPFLLHFDSIGEAATALKHIQRNWAPYQFQLFRRAALLQEKLPYLNLKERQFFKNGQCSIDIPHSAMGLYTLLDEHTLLASAKTSSCLPTGIVRLAQDHVNPPSRAYLKLQEALVLARHFFGVELPANGMRCFDAGACPGGWTWVLTELGATVLAVDRAELAPQLMEHPRVTFRMHDAFTLKPQDVGAFDWVCGAAGTFFLSLLGYLCGGIGASDVKLLSVAGGFLGEKAIFFLPVHTLLFAGAMSVIYLVRQGRLIDHLRDLARMIPEVLCGSCLLPVSKTRIPLVPCILGAVILWYLKGGGH